MFYFRETDKTACEIGFTPVFLHCLKGKVHSQLDAKGKTQLHTPKQKYSVPFLGTNFRFN